MEKKFIKVKTRPNSADNKFTVVTIVEQSHRNKDFGKDGDKFIAKNGITLHSNNYPAFGTCLGVPTFNVRGKENCNDNRVMDVSPATAKQIVAAVDEYNEYFSATRIIVTDDTQYTFKFNKFDILITKDGPKTIQHT